MTPRSSGPHRGQVGAAGTHDELLDTSPLYRELAAAQLLV